MRAIVCCVVLAVVLTASAQTSNTSQETLVDVMCQLFLGDIPRCPASSCKEAGDTKLWSARSGYHWLARNAHTFQAYCRPSIPPSESRGWMRVADISASQGCPSGLEPVTAGGRKMCRKTVDRGCSSVTFPTHGFSYSKVCGWARGYNKDTTDGFVRHQCSYCTDHHPLQCVHTHCTINRPYVDGISITRGHPRKHIWSLAAAARRDYYCPCADNPSTRIYVPSFVGNDYSCEYEGRNTYISSDRLWDGYGCSARLQRCCGRGSWFCKELPQPTTDAVEFRLCTDQSRGDEDVYIENFELYVQ